MPKSSFRLLLINVTVGGLVLLGTPALAAGQRTSLSVSPASGPAGSAVVVTGSGWDPRYYSGGVQISFYQNHGNGVLTRYADSIRVPIDQQGRLGFRTTIPASFKAGDLLTISGLIGNGGGADANFRVTSSAGAGTNGPATVTVGRTYAANSEWKEATRFRPKDVIRYQVVIKASASTTIGAKMRVTGPGGRVLLDSGGNVDVTATTGSVFFESSIPVDAPAGTYRQAASVTFDGNTVRRANSFVVEAPVFDPDAFWFPLRETSKKNGRTFFIPFDYRNDSIKEVSKCYGRPFAEIWHAGEDWGAPADADVMASGAGTVVYSSKDPGTTRTYPGGVIIIEHELPGGRSVWTMYGHVKPDGIKVSKGDTVTKGQVIASGLAPHPGKYHLHWEVRSFFDGSGITNAAGTSCAGIPGPGYTYPDRPGRFTAPNGSTYSWLNPSDYVRTH